MSSAEIFTAYYEILHRVIKGELTGLTHAASLVQPLSGGNCLNRVLGHIVYYGRESVLGCLGEQVPWTQAESARYYKHSEPITRQEQALPLEQIIEALERSQALILAALQRLSEAELNEQLDEETRAEKIRGLQWHETYHAGQLELLGQLARSSAAQA